ncbi:MAG: hypothetical protein IPH95_06165 [Candidatus Promineofilum sp.]|nr:hypothetical protein [Promineifilum sp.]
MQASKEFTGLTMPVFSAFGWAGEENALKYALSQLQLFIESLYLRLPADARDDLPAFGLSAENQNVYLATADPFDKEAFIAFNARPMSLEVQLGMVGQNLLSKGLAAVNKDPVAAHHVLTQLDPSWTLRVQQMQIDAEAGERAHHLDLYKDSVNNLTEEQAREIFERAAYLTEEDKWVTPVYLSLRLPSERVAAMGLTVLEIAAELVVALMPTLRLFTGRKPKKARAARTAKARAARPAEPVEETPAGEPTITGSIKAMADSFSYVADLKPLHIRRGFINLTPAHWPFFASSSRSETRDVTVVFGGRQDRHSSVWRLQPDDQARLVLGPQVHEWLEETFATSESIRVLARRLDNDEIRITLEPAG